ncbi:lycopene beta-cyclase [Isoptericola jiangsuensis]|uniref:Lycopene beta-cyclase n=1 Tax=Isoptericola jiangsuensis TaxID=548579 RepID=A0A2A9EWS2_9MICO|nr:lycopene cyclase family protein [Isoptericola jiangsuensis]PFG42685.1 lycopene beta-cyclase [Isoptericola jiangsuensis]
MMKDVAVVGLGPAGRALASRCAAHGSSVLAVDPRPDAVWTPTYGIWADELGDLPSSVVRARAANPELRSVGVHPLDRGYLVLDNAALQAALPLDDVEVRTGRLDDAQVAALRGEARVVVDARGARPDGLRADDPAPMQTAYGIVVRTEDALPALQGAESLLMDWRTDWSADERPTATPTFLYAVPVGDDRMLLEETCLAAAPGMPVAELRGRLRRRLLARGVDARTVDDPLDREVVRIPMRGRGAPPPPGVLAVGTAGRGGHLITGYSVAHSLRRADTLAQDLAHGHAPDDADQLDATERLRQVGLRALLRLSTRGTLELFEGFGRLPAALRRGLLSRDAGTTELARAMWGMFAAMPVAAQAELVRATTGLPRARS